MSFEIKNLISSKDNTTIIYPNIVEGNIPSNAISNEKIAPNAVKEVNIQDATVSTSKIKDFAITHGKLATSSIDTNNLRDACINNDKLALECVEGDNIAPYPLLIHESELLNIDELKGNIYLIRNTTALTIVASSIHLITFDSTAGLRINKIPNGTNGFKVIINGLTASEIYYLYVSNDGYNVVFNHRVLNIT